MSRPSTSLQRTYRYLRLAIAGSVVVVFAGVAVSLPRVGLLPSISHYYYSPGNTVFVGALIAVAVCFFALSGRGAERVLLDVAAVILPLVAIVPTVISPGSVPGIDSTCARSARTCVPESFDAAVDTGILTYLVVALVAVAVAVALLLSGEVERSGTLLSLAISVAILLVVGLFWWLARDVFLRWAHLGAAVAFFSVIAAVALINAIAPAADDAPRWLRRVYIAIAVALAAVVLGLPLYGEAHVGSVYGVFVGEVVALALFAAFWILQSVQYWRADDPSIMTRD